MPRLREASGQASVEFVALLPVVLVAAAALWQAVLVGQAIWDSAGAARAAARAQAIGGDAEASARAALPVSLRHGTAVAARSGGVRVDVPIPLVFGGDRLATVSARASLPPQR